MSLLEIYKAFEAKDESAERAAFDKSMEEKINKDGFKMGDLVWALFKAEKAISALDAKLESMIAAQKGN